MVNSFDDAIESSNRLSILFSVSESDYPCCTFLSSFGSLKFQTY